MCGIIGYNGNQDAVNILMNGLKRLEYRGYDSAGIALMSGENLSVFKSPGKLENLSKKVESISSDASVGIGHTRWATHGKPDETNAHPHTAENGMFTVVHNGIIENHNIIRDALKEKGYNFISETDTEVIPQLLSYHYNGNVHEAIRKTFSSLDGSFATAILCKDTPDTVYAAKKDSPLAVGRGKDESFIASDVAAFSEYGEEAVFLEDGEFAQIEKNEITFYDSELNVINKTFEKIRKSDDEHSKGSFPHFMLKEIYEQPEKIRNLVKQKIKNDKIFIDELAGLSIELSKAEKFYIVACGSAYHAGLAGKFAIEELCRIPTEVCIASEFRYSNPPLNEKTPVIIISQSGETADSVAALRLANSRGAMVVGIVNVLASTIANESDFCIATKAGREVAVATTKGYTTQLTALYLLALHIADLRKTVSDGEIEFFVKELVSVPDKISSILSDTTDIEKIARKYAHNSNIFFIGRNTDFVCAAEASLKLKEISYINCSSLPAGELKHGTIALIEKDTPVFAICGNERLFKKTLSNIEEVASRGADVTCVCRKNSIKKYDAIEIPHCTDLFLPLLEIIPLQLLAYYIAKNKGCSIDMPKNLAKSVTVE